MNKQQCSLQGYAHKRDGTGTITTVISIKDVNELAVEEKIEVPYHNLYEQIPQNTVLLYTRNGTLIEIEFPSNNQYFIGTELKCPFCGSSLINLTEENYSAKHCFNVGCFDSKYAKILNIYSFISNQDIFSNPNPTNIVQTLTDLYANTQPLAGQLHILHILYVLWINYNNQPNPVYHGLLTQLSSFVKTCSVSSFLKMLNIPLCYYEDLEIFDNDFECIEDFYIAIQNHRAISIYYPKDLLNLIYISFHINDAFIKEFFTVKKVNRYMV